MFVLSVRLCIMIDISGSCYIYGMYSLYCLYWSESELFVSFILNVSYVWHVLVWICMYRLHCIYCLYFIYLLVCFACIACLNCLY